MVVGETGTGKTTLLNCYLNYLLGIELTDKFRYKIIHEDKTKFGGQHKSQTSKVTTYNIRRPTGNPIIIVDTPGFGVTGEIDVDMKTVSLIKDCFTKEISSIKEKYGDFIVMVARVDMPKNHKGLINAMEYLYEQYGFVYNIVFVGDGVLRKQLEEYASTTKIREHIFFVGNQPNPQNYYAAAKLFVLSTISEGLPTVLIEAAYFGLPLISSDASVREILGNNEFGLIAPVYDDKKLAQNIYTVLSNPDIYSKYSDLSKERYREFAPSRISEQIEDYINNLK